MKNTAKALTAAVLTAVLACSAAGCSTTSTSWSFKTKDATITNGEWIFATYSKYNEALGEIQEQNTAAAESSASSTPEVNVNTAEIDGKKAIDWIYDEAKKFCVRQLLLEKLVKENGVEIDEDELASTQNIYISYYYSGGKDFYEKLGVGEQSFADYVARPDYLSDKLFLNLYSEGGAFAVSDEELFKYFTDNYTDYFYISCPLTTMDDETEATVAISDEKKETIETNLNKYRVMLNNENATRSDVTAAYQEDFGTETDPTVHATTILEDSTLSEELKVAVGELEEGKAVVKEIGDNLYLIYRGVIADQTENIKPQNDIDPTDSDALARESLLHKMRDEEYKTYLEEQEAKLTYDENAACLSKYSVQRTIDIIKADSSN